MLPEIVNHIFCYVQGSTNIIMKEYIKYSRNFATGVIGLTRFNRQYGFVHFNKKKLMHAMTYNCPVCKINLWSDEYKQNINYQGTRMCSRSCLIEYEVAISMLHMSY
jgi:hypothetical protein